jgi:hypothetical protein
MTALKWWLRVVGLLYVLEGGGLTLAAWLGPDEFAAIWASTTAGSLDAIAVRGIRVAGLPGVLTWLLLGAMMWIYSRAPAKAELLVVIVAAWELLVWLPVDIVASSNGFVASRSVSLAAIHLAIGISGILLLRRARRSTDAAAFASGVSPRA